MSKCGWMISIPALLQRLTVWTCLFVGAFHPMVANAESDFYRNKQIEIDVGATPGDAYDIYARIVARVMSKYIPGNPTFVVRNMPGAGGLIVANYIYNTAPSDGTVIAAATQSIPTASLLSPSGVRYDPTKLSWIGSLTKDVFVAYVWQASPIRTLDDLLTETGTFGANAVGSAGIDFPLVVRDILGLKLKVISGYAGQPAVRLAMERGEIDGSFGNGWASLRATQPTWISQGKVRLLAQFGARRDPEIPGDVPVMMDLVRSTVGREELRLVTARQEFSKPYVAPPAISAARLAILRNAFDDTIKDPQFIEETKRAELPIYGPMTGSELAATTLELSQTPPPIVKRILTVFKRFQNGR
jgi:tripartite-type tricarboxylate transporter receptor subunit TctC